MAEIEHFGSNPGNLKMFVHHQQQGDTMAPLVIVLHGCGQTAASVDELTGWSRLSDLNKFMIIFPQQKLQNNIDLCFNWFNQKDITKNQGECESIFQMIVYAKEHYSIDTNRIYITGLSAGGAMSVVMTATHPEIFKYAAIFEGGAYKVATNQLESIRTMLSPKFFSAKQLKYLVVAQNTSYIGNYPAMIIYQGLDDGIVNYKNAELLVKQWTAVNNADTMADRVERSYMGIKDISRYTYNDSSGKIVVTLYEVENMGHEILIKPGAKENEGGNPGLYGMDKGYHSTYQTATEFGIIKKP